MSYKRSICPNYFAQQFQDSEIDFTTQSYLNKNEQIKTNDIYVNIDPHPVQLIRILHSGKLQICPEGLNIIKDCQIPIGFVAIAGKNRTGKSFLLNKLIKLKKKGFMVNPPSKIATQGIWIWSQPIFNEKYGNNIFYIGQHFVNSDTVGFDISSKNLEVDEKIFTLASLISSYFLYNSIGSIDEASIQDIHLFLSNLSRKIQMKTYATLQENSQLLQKSNFMPNFLWILRDFDEKLLDKHGKKITAKEYLLQNINGENSQYSYRETVKRTHQFLKTYFKDLDCIPIAKPIQQNLQLQHLSNISDKQLTKQFINSIAQLQAKIYESACPKYYEGNPLYGTAMAGMIQHFVSAINYGNNINIRAAWQKLAQTEGSRAYTCTIAKYKQMVDKQFKAQQPKEDHELFKSLKLLQQAALHNFSQQMCQDSQSDYQAYLERLKQTISQIQQKIIQINKEKSKSVNQQIMQNCASKLLKMIFDQQTIGKQNEISLQLARVQVEYKSKAKGNNKDEELNKLLIVVTPVILDIIAKQKQSIPKANNNNEINNLKEEAQNMKRRLNQKNEEIKKLKLEKPPKKEKDGENIGCCQSCMIM